MGGGGGSSSSSTTTNNSDKRLAVGDGGMGITGDGSSITSHTTINTLDGGAIAKAFDFAKAADATNADGFKKMLDASLSMFNTSQGLIGQTQKSVADAYSQATANKSGTFDQKTIVILAAIGAAALVLPRMSARA